MTPYIVLGGLVLLLIAYLLVDWHLGRPQWRVKYPPDAKYNFKGGYSIRMTWWIAKDYAKIFGGEVVRHEEIEYPEQRLTAEEVEAQDPERHYYNGL